jgi:hypothetical protein
VKIVHFLFFVINFKEENAEKLIKCEDRIFSYLIMSLRPVSEFLCVCLLEVGIFLYLGSDNILQSVDNS